MSEQKPQSLYVGYLPKLPPGHKRPVAVALAALGLMVVLAIVLFTIAERPLPNAHFDYGTLTEHEGILQLSPYPMLQIDRGKDPSGKTIFQSLLLVNAGKHGAKDIAQRIAEGTTLPLETSMVKLRGTLIYFDGKSVLELSEGIDAFLGIRKIPEPDYSTSSHTLGEMILKGEVVDPKCFFGVMNPGYGKVHLSCARRCLSGGIPPVFRTTDTKRPQYYVLTSKNGEVLGMEILPLVGYETTLSGLVSERNDWQYFAISDSVLSRLSAKALENPTNAALSPLIAQIPVCR